MTASPICRATAPRKPNRRLRRRGFEPLQEIEENPELKAAMVKVQPEHVDLQDFYAHPQPLPVLGLLIFWSLTSLIAYSLAGEKMPWLTVHIALPLLLAAGLGIGFPGRYYRLAKDRQPPRIAGPGAPAGLLHQRRQRSAGSAGSQPALRRQQPRTASGDQPFYFLRDRLHCQCRRHDYLLRGWKPARLLRLMHSDFFALLAVSPPALPTALRLSITITPPSSLFMRMPRAARRMFSPRWRKSRAARREAKISPWPIPVMRHIPYWWYFRDYPNERWFGDQPTRELNDVPVIIAGEDVYNKMEPIVGDDFVMFEYMRLWWPMQDYLNLNWERISSH